MTAEAFLVASPNTFALRALNYAPGIDRFRTSRGHHRSNRLGDLISELGGSFGTVPKPALSGVSTVGRLLQVNAKVDTWVVAPDTVSYDWRRDGVSMGLSTDTTSYRLTNADQGHTITVLVTGSKVGYTSVTKLSYSKVIPA